MAAGLSAEFEHMLFGGRLRIGTVQKAHNLNLKTLWCQTSGYPTPPHCPIDRRILEKAGISGVWTKLDSIGTYRYWIARLQANAWSQGYESLSEWELCAWDGA